VSASSRCLRLCPTLADRELAKSTAYDIYRTTVRTFGQPVAIKKRHTGADRFAIGVWDGKRWRELVKRTRDLDGSAEATTSCNQIDLVAQVSARETSAALC
jgi:hypothetical protein